MSLLGQNVYANPTTPLWLGTAGGTIDGSLVVDGSIVATGGIQSDANMSAPVFIALDPSGNEAGLMRPAGTGAGAGLLFQGDLFKFGKVGTGNVNTTLTTSVFGANTDTLSIGGTMNCLVGPVPTQLITSTKNVEPVAVSPAAPSQFGVDTTVVGIANAEYDVQVTGNVYLVSGIPAATDTVVFTFTSGASGGLTSVLYTAATDAAIGNYGVSGSGPLTIGGTACGVLMRARVSPSVSGTTLGASVRAFLGGGSTAVYGANLLLLDVQRVR